MYYIIHTITNVEIVSIFASIGEKFNVEITLNNQFKMFVFDRYMLSIQT